MATTTYTVGISADTTQAREELSEVKKLLTELEKNKVKLKPEFDSKNIEKQVNQLGKYMEGKFGALDFSKVYSNLMRQAQSDPNVFAKSLGRAMHGFNLLDQAVKPEDISKLAAASAEEIFELVKGLGGLADTTKATGTPVTKRLQALYDKYPNGIEGKGGSGRGNGFGASEETLNKISETLERIDGNVKNINDSIKTGAITVQAAAESAENVADKTKEAASAQAKLTEEAEKTAKAEKQLGQVQEKNNKKEKNNSDKKTEEKKTEEKPPAQPPASPSAPSNKKDEKVTTNKPKSIVPEVDTKPLEAAIKKEEDLKTATEGAVQALEKQKGEKLGGSDTPVNHATAEIDAQQTMLAAFLDSAKKAGAITQELGQKQGELAKAFQNTNAQIEEQNKTLNESQQTAQQSMFNAFANNAQKSGEALQQLGQQQGKLLSEAFQKNNTQITDKTSIPDVFDIKELIQRSGDLDSVQQYVYTIEEAKKTLKNIKSKYIGKKEDNKLLDSSDAREVWAALNSLDQISLYGSDEEVEQINQIFDRYEEWVERYVTQDPLQTGALDKLSALFERMNAYRDAFNKDDNLSQLRELYSLDTEQKSAVMTPDQTIQGYTYALDRVKVILETMEQYKAAIEEAQAKGREITEIDQKFLDDYDKTRSQWTRAGERAQNNLIPLQEQQRSQEETRKRIEQEKEYDKQRRILKQQMRRQDRQASIEEDQQFETDFQNYDIKNIENMDLEEIDRQINQLEAQKQKNLDLKGELNRLKKAVTQNSFYDDEEKIEDEIIALMTPTEQESKWLEGYDARIAKRKEYSEALKKRKSQLKKELTKKENVNNPTENGDQGSVDQTQKDADAAQRNADAAQEAANKAQKAANESEDAVKRANDAQKKAGENSSPQKDESASSVASSKNANQKAQKNVKYVEESKESLEANLSQLQEQMNKLQEQKEQLEKTKKLYGNTASGYDDIFELEAQDSGKTIEQYKKDKTKEATDALKKLEVRLKEKQAEIKQTQDKINHITELEQQGFDVQVQGEDKGKKKSGKPKIIIPNQGQAQSSVDGQIIEAQVAEEKKDGEAAQQLGDQTKQTNDKLHEAEGLAEEQDQLLEAIFSKGMGKNGDQNGNGKGLQIENSAIANLIEKLKEIPAVTQILTDFDAANSNIANNAKNVAEAIQAEADAFSSMTQVSQGINGGQLIASDKKSGGLLGNTKNELEEIEQKKDQYKKITDQIKAIEDGRAQAEEEIARHNTSDKNFKVGRSKNKAYDLIKTYAEQLKQDYEAYEKLDPNDTSEKAKEIIAKYETSRVAFDKAASKLLSPGIPKDKMEEGVEFGILREKHGVGSKGFEEAEKHVADNLKFLEERLNQQKQQAEVVLQKLYAERDRLQQELTSSTKESKPSGNIAISPDKKSTNSPIVENAQNVKENAENELKQAQTVEQQIEAKIESIRAGVRSLEHELQEYSLEDSRFDVGTNKTKAFSQAKQFADQLKQDYEALSAIDKTANPTEYEAKMEQYIKSRVAFSKAYEKMLAIGYPSDKDKGTKKNPISPVAQMAELYKQHGAGSQGYDEDLREFENMAQEMRTQFEQYKANAEQTIQLLEQERVKAGLGLKGASTSPQANVPVNGNNPPADKPDLGGSQSANGIRTEGDEAGNVVANMQALAKAKQEVTEANQQLSQSAQETTNSLNGEAGAGANASEAFDPKPLQDQIDVQKKAIDEQKKALEQQKSTIVELKKANEDLAKAQAQASKEKMDNLRKENETFKKAQQTELEQRRQAELNAQVAANLQKKQFEEDERIRKEQEAKAAKKAEEKAKEAEEQARIKAEDKDFSKIYTEYGKDYSSILDAKSIQEFDAAVAHLTETERLFWEARMLQAGGTSYAHNADVLKQDDLPEGYEKSVDTQTTVLKQREMAIAEYTATVIAELEKQEAAFEKMDALYQIDTKHPANGHASFIQKSLVDEGQTRTYVTAIEEVSGSLQRMREIVQSMKDGTFDFGNIDALRELLELRQNLPNQMTTAKDADKAYKKAQSDIEADSIKKAEQYKTVLTGLEKQIETIQKNSRKLINPDDNYKVDLEAAKDLLATIQVMIEELNANPLQFMGKQGDKNAKNMQSIIDTFKDSTDGLQEDFLSQKGVQGRINTYLTSYKGAYTSFFREIKDSFKSEALGELQGEIDKTFVTFENSITDLNRATGLKQGEFLTQYLNANGGKASASQIEQQQKVRNAIAESYRGLITDISNELTKVQDRMGKVLGEDFLKTDYFQKFGERFTAGLGSAKDFNAFQDSAQKARDSFSELQKIQKEMADGKLDLTSLAPDELKKRIEEIVGLFATLNENYQKVNKNAKEFTLADPGDIEKQRASIAQFLKNNPAINFDAQNALRDYFNQLQQGISQADLSKLTDGWHQVADAEQAAGRTGATFMSELQARFKSLGAYLLSFVSFYRVIGVFKDGINIIHELDDALTEMQKVSDESLSTLQEYQKGTFDTADKIGTTAAQLQQSTADWMRLGEDLQTASQSAQTANVLFNVSEFDNINEATTALVAMSAAYADAEKGIEKMDIVDKLNLIGNNYAIATDELATALQDGAATLQTAGKQHCQNL